MRVCYSSRTKWELTDCLNQLLPGHPKQLLSQGEEFGGGYFQVLAARAVPKTVVTSITSRLSIFSPAVEESSICIPSPTAFTSMVSIGLLLLRTMLAVHVPFVAASVAIIPGYAKSIQRRTDFPRRRAMGYKARLIDM